MARAGALPVITAESGLARYLEEIRQFPMLEPQEEFNFATAACNQEQPYSRTSSRNSGRDCRKMPFGNLRSIAQ
jgi:hypothetical protein